MPNRLSVGATVRIKHLPQTMTVIAEPKPAHFHCFIAAGKTLFNVPAELLELAESADIVPLARSVA